ncbi:MAG: 1,4-dihydroxy-2-naphthoate polyprenyltransferase [Marinoscillum sp.]|uniref:1,4-dihydroxy-2-naphthoate polyprenyltransferase n=1 Tax=Marinoscillum sp. TaxID=2024838 RepID=UPI0032F5C054
MKKIKAWLQAFRFRTLPLAFSCIFMGAFLAAANGCFSWPILIWSLVTTLFLQVLSNLANDYGDATSGVDGVQRTGPKRTVSSGLISLSAMKRALIVFSLLSLFSGLWLIFLSFGDRWTEIIIFLILGLGAIVAAIKYTVGKKPYGYAGFGDLFVLIFFGLVGVGGSYYLYANTLDSLILLPALSCGLLAVGVLNVNNIRDIDSDQKAGKYSIPVRIGRSNAVLYHWFLLSMAVISSCVYVAIVNPRGFSFLFLLVLPMLYSNARAVKIMKTSQGLDPFLKQLALTTLIFVILFGLGQVVFS